MDGTIKVGDVLEGKVTGIQPYGAFVSFPNGQQGLIHISEISSKFVRHIADFLTIGMQIRVKVIDIDEKNNYTRLSLKQLTERERQVIRRPPILKKKRVMIPEDELDFKPLAEHLPQWIKEALEREE